MSRFPSAALKITENPLFIKMSAFCNLSEINEEYWLLVPGNHLSALMEIKVPEAPKNVPLVQKQCA